MQKEILTRCGYRCDLCLAYNGNIEKEDRREEASKGWKKCFDLNVAPEKIYCEGCMSEGDPVLIDDTCPVRPCAIEKDMDNCAQCDAYPSCDTFKQRAIDYDAKFGDRDDITAKDRELFILPYENKARLDALRNSS